MAPNSRAERDPVGVAAEQDDLLGAEPLGGDHAAQADGAVADDGDRPARADPGGERRVVAGPHHVREGEQRRHQRVVLADRQRDERAVGQRDAHRLALAAVEPSRAQKPPCRQEVCRPSRQKTQVPSDQANGATTRSPALTVRTSAPTSSTTPMNSWPIRLAGRRSAPCWLVRPQVAAADAGAGDADQRVGGLDEPGVGDVLDPDVAGAEHDGCAHGWASVVGRRCRRPLKQRTAPGDRPC